MTAVHLSLVAAFVFVLGTARAGDDPTELILISDVGVVTYDEIRCPAAQRENAGKCVASEQRALAARMYEFAVDAASAMWNVQLTAAEASDVEQRVDGTRALATRATEEYVKIVGGVLRIRRGEHADAVIAELVRAGSQRPMIEMILDEMTTAEDAVRVLARNHAAEAEAAARAYHTRRLIRRKLAARIRECSATDRTTASREAATLWQSVLAKYHFQILNQTYHMPDFKGVLDEHL